MTRADAGTPSSFVAASGQETEQGAFDESGLALASLIASPGWRCRQRGTFGWRLRLLERHQRSQGQDEKAIAWTDRNVASCICDTGIGPSSRTRRASTKLRVRFGCDRGQGRSWTRSRSWLGTRRRSSGIRMEPRPKSGLARTRLPSRPLEAGALLGKRPLVRQGLRATVTDSCRYPADRCTRTRADHPWAMGHGASKRRSVRRAMLSGLGPRSTFAESTAPSQSARIVRASSLTGMSARTLPSRWPSARH